MPESPSPIDHRETTSLDSWLSKEFRQAYERKYRVLNTLGMLDILPESGEMGIIGIDNKEYPIPSREVFEQEIRRNRETCELKFSQGFTDLQLTPFAVPLDYLITTVKTRILAHHKAGTLLGTKEHPNDPDEHLKLDLETPLWVWDEWKGSDVQGACVYYPASLTQENHQGKIKTDILQAQEGSPLAGWNALLVEPGKNIPRQGKGKTIGGRPQLEANHSSIDYLNMLSTDPHFAHEQPLTNEDWLTMFITHLEETNQVIDDFQGKGSACFLPGSFNPASRHVGRGDWDRGFRRAYLGRRDPGNRDSANGLRSAVGVGRKY